VFDLDQLTSSLWGDRQAARADGVPVPAAVLHRIALAAAGGEPALATVGGGATLAAAPDLAMAETADAAAQPPATAKQRAVRTASGNPLARVLVDDRVTIGSRIAMSVTMALMLALMI
jgi:hypothetical protein